MSKDGKADGLPCSQIQVSNEFTGAYSCTDIKPRLADLQEIPRSWFLVPPELSNSRHIEVIISSKDTVLTVDEIDTVDQVCLILALTVDTFALSNLHRLHPATIKRAIYQHTNVSKWEFLGLCVLELISLGGLVNL